MVKLLFTSCILALILGQALVECAASCGKPTREPSIKLDGSRQRIINGQDAIPNSYPWTVSVHVAVPGRAMRHACGGALVRVDDGDSTDIVVTAAHCINSNWQYKVLAGAHSQSKPASTQQSIDVSDVLQHEAFSSKTGINDIGLLKLSTPVQFNDYIQPICLPDVSEHLAAGTKGIVVGWGYVNVNTKASSDVLQQVMLPVIGDKQCVSSYGTKLKTDEMMCAGFAEGGQDACTDDSGGPYITKVNGTYVLSGIVSWGEGCAVAGKPGVFVRVPTYVPWIQENSQMLTSLSSYSSYNDNMNAYWSFD